RCFTGGAFERPTWWSAASKRNGAAPECCLASARRKNASSSSLLYCGGPAPAGGVFVSASSSRSSWRTTLRPASDYSRRTSASLTCRRGRRPPHEPDHFLQTEWDLTSREPYRNRSYVSSYVLRWIIRWGARSYARGSQRTCHSCGLSPAEREPKPPPLVGVLFPDFYPPRQPR